MEKVFEEYRSETGTIPYKTSTVLFCLAQYAKDYITSDCK